MTEQKPLELILARNLLSSISTPAFLTGPAGRLLFFNEAAGALIGRRFEETGAMSAEEWTRAFGPLDTDDRPTPLDEIPLTVALREGRAAHGIFRVRGASGNSHEVSASAIPIVVGTGGSSGAIVFFWPQEPEGT
jgi:PAS domain-containing protein